MVHQKIFSIKTHHQKKAQYSVIYSLTQPINIAVNIHFLKMAILLGSPHSFKPIERPVPSVSAFWDDSVGVSRCSWVLAIETGSDLSFVSLALHRSIRYTPLPCSYPASLPLGQVVQDYRSTFKSRVTWSPSSCVIFCIRHCVDCRRRLLDFSALAPIFPLPETTSRGHSKPTLAVGTPNGKSFQGVD